MTRYVAFLRGINLGKRRVKMDLLAELFEELGFENVQTFIASGNVIFESSSDEEELVAATEAHLRERLGYNVDVFVRSMDELQAIARRDVFKDMDPSGWTVHVIFLRDELSEDDAEVLGKLERDEDRFESGGREIYWLRHGRFSETTLSRAEVSRIGGGRSTTVRNMNTVVHINNKYGRG